MYNDELVREEVEMWLVWDSTSPTLDVLLTEMDMNKDSRADYIQDECTEWIKKRLNKLLEDYKGFIDSKLNE